VQRVGFFGLSAAVETRAPTSSAMSILCPFAIVFSNASTACPEARKQCTCEALICMSCHKQVQRWKCAAFVREGLHTLPNIPSRPCRIAVDRPYPASASNRRSITGFCNNPCYTSVAGLCADASLGTASAQTSHDCQDLVRVWWLPWVSGRAAPRPQYKYYCTSSQETVVVGRQGMVAGICPVGSTGTKPCGHTVSTA
jgi:hypothetical protein